MIEVNPAPETARSDGPQALGFAGLHALGERLGLKGDHVDPDGSYRW